MIKQGLDTLKFAKTLKKLSRIDDEFTKQKLEVYLDELLGQSGGILTKVLQYKQTTSGQFKDLKKEGLKKEIIENILKTNLANEYSYLSNLSEEAFCASVGQVHTADYKERKIALKVKYPKIEESFRKQLQLMKLLPSAVGMTSLKKWGIDFKGYQQELDSLLKNECDYEREAQELKEWKKIVENLPFVDVPEVIDELSGSNILAMDFIDGDDLQTVIDTWSDIDKRDFAEKFISSFFHLFLNSGRAQGDTNYGNFLFNRSEKKIYYLDMGQSVQFSDSLIKAFHYLFYSKLNGEKVCSYSFFVALGFDQEKLKMIHHKLPLIEKVLVDPFFAEYPFNVKDWNYKKELDLALGDDKWWFRSAGSTEFFIFMKAFLGIKSIIGHFDVNLFYKKIFQKIPLQEHTIPKLHLKSETHEYISTHIRIRIERSGVEKVNMTMPFISIFNLDAYFDDDVKEKIENQGIDISEVIKKALSDGGKPKDFFEIQNDDKKICLSMVAEK